MAGSGSGKRRSFREGRRAAYLEVLGRTGSHKVASEAAEVSARAARRRRARDPDFAAACDRAEQAAERRLRAEREARGRPDRSELESIRRGADGRLKVQARGKRRWSAVAEEQFFAMLLASGNIAGAARAAGVSREAVWKRRREWPAFAQRLEQVLDEAEIVLEFRVACLGTNWPSDDAIGEGSAAADGAHAAAAAAPFDPELALRFLKWREAKRQGRQQAVAALPPVEDVRARIIRKVAATGSTRR
jgi:molybdenum-dependent DNA-binding transcriptional regulator ModE